MPKKIFVMDHKIDLSLLNPSIPENSLSKIRYNLYNSSFIMYIFEKPNTTYTNYHFIGEKKGKI